MPPGLLVGVLLALLLMAPLFLAITLDVLSNDDSQRIAARTTSAENAQP
jgi:hypothetical protein